MNILIDIGHPGHVHLFRNFADNLKRNGHKVYFTAKKKDNIAGLLDAYNIAYISLGKKYDNIILKYIASILHLARMYYLVKSKKIDIAVGVSGLISFISKFTQMNSICLDDDDAGVTPLFAKSINNAGAILTPEALKNDDRGSQHITYCGYHELAYLHPIQFTPDPNVVIDLGLDEGEKYFILRFNAFRAHHDGGEHGMDQDQKQKLIQFLLPYGKVFISSEEEKSEFEKYKHGIKPEKIHSVLYYATMFIGDSQTMCSEAAVLGIPALKCNTFAGRLSIPNELEEKYGLCYAYKPKDFNLMLEKAQELLKNPNLRDEFQSRCQKMLSEKIDVSAFMGWFVENYPKSRGVMKKNPEIQYRYK